MKNTVTTVQWRRRIALGLLLVLGAWGLFMALRPQPLEVDIGTASRADAARGAGAGGAHACARPLCGDGAGQRLCAQAHA